jgi:hypothetical protein
VLRRVLSSNTLPPDPTDPQDLNRSTYAKNNPLRYNDPTGHRSCGQGACYEGGGQLGGTGGPGARGAGSAGQAALDVGVVIVFVTQAGARVTNAVGEFVTAITSGAGAAAEGNTQGQRQGDSTITRADTNAAGETSPESAFSSDTGGQTADPGGIDPQDPWEDSLVRDYNDSQRAEIKRHLEKWDKATYESEAHSVVNHAQRHGYGNNYLEYMRRASNFNTRGATRKVLDAYTNTVRYTRKDGQFIIYRDGKIVTYGVNR